MDEVEAITWADRHLANSTRPVLALAPWILDTDNTVKCLYGKQEGAVKSYNPKKPGRPSHAYHSYFMANTRMALGVEVEAGDKHTGKHVSVGLWQLLDGMPRELWPVFINTGSIRTRSYSRRHTDISVNTNTASTDASILPVCFPG